MPHKPLKIGVLIVGEQFPRFVVVNNRRRFWSGEKWTAEFRKALLYAHPWFAEQDAEGVRQKYSR